MPLYFIENRGQLDPRVAYYIQGRDKTLYFAKDGITFSLTDRKSSIPSREGRLENASSRDQSATAGKAPSRWTVKLDLVGANPAVKIAGDDKTAAVISYFKGPRKEWTTGLSTYSRLVYADVWPGIDLVYSGTANQLKYTFVVEPGADPGLIRLAYRGAAVRLNESGQLEVETPVGGFRDDRPYSYQDAAGGRVEVQSRFALRRGEEADPVEYGFRVASYDKTRPLIIDPAVLVYAGYIGGREDEQGGGIAVDSMGNAYVTGVALSSQTTFPVTVGPDLTHNGGDIDPVDAFVAKVNAAGTALEYAGYIGGSGNEQGHGIAVDAAGNAYVTGWTFSTEATFPVTIGPDLTFNGAIDAFVARVNAAGTGLDYAGYIGGASSEFGRAIAVDGLGNACISGFARSTETTFPVSIGPDLTFNGGLEDAFVARVNAAGTALDYAGYIGGSGDDQGWGIAVDGPGNAYVIGSTQSSEATFPVIVGPDLTYNGGGDAFVAKVDATGTTLNYAGYIGGSGSEDGRGIAVDDSGNAYVTGSATSTEATFPAAVGPDLTFNGGSGDAFVARVNAAGTALDYAGYIGGIAGDAGGGVAVDGTGNAYITGGTQSDEATFPVAVGPDLTFNSSFNTSDAFVARVNAAGTALDYAGYIGGIAGDGGGGVAVDALGNAYITGTTHSDEATFPVTVGPDLTYDGFSFSGFTEAFVAKVSFVVPPTPTPTPTDTPTPTPTPTPTVTPGTTILTVTPGTATPGGTVTATWSGIATPTSWDWIGLFAQGAADTSYVTWMYVSCSQTPGAARASGSCRFLIPSGLPPGPYELRLFSNNSFTRLATSGPLTVAPPGPQLSVRPGSVPPGGTVTATWSGIATPTPADWIGLFAQGAPDTSYVTWTYVSCSQTPGTARAAGSCPFVIPAALATGTYELRLLANNGFTRLATSGPLNVAPSGPQLSVSPGSVDAGGTVTATWSGIATPTPADWIGLFAQGAADTVYVTWMYVSCSQTPGAARAAGSCAFVIPGGLAPGTYELRLLANNGFTRLAASGALTVTP